jgi:hypothetical protein
VPQRYTVEQQETLQRLRSEIEAANTSLTAEVGSRLAPGARLIGTPGYWRQPQGRLFLLVPPGEILNQYGTTWFRALPRFDAPIVQVAISMLLGKHSVAMAPTMNSPSGSLISPESLRARNRHGE